MTRHTKANSSTPPTSVVLRDRSARLCAEPGALLLDRDGTRRRIPLAAVERVRADDARQRSVAVVLTAADGVPGTVFRLNCRNSAAVTAFADAVNGALPRREDGAPRRDGAELVRVLPPKRRQPWEPNWWFAGITAGLVFFVAGFVTLVARGDVMGAILWIIGVSPLVKGLAVLFLVVRALCDRLILWRRGITVLAVRYGSGYAFTDAKGTERRVEIDGAAKPVSTKPARYEVSYDPLRPGRTAAVLPVGSWILRTLGVVFLLLPVVALGLYLVPFQLVESLFL
ncbi:hypothetical protein ACIO1C_23525 [Streptomyces sp. NPDC087420]|uniref:hypothetical protein n=1 Tax=Streptomyces sp. NPDC087420 TaxID=3365785 RepID=UPI003837C8B0